MSTPVAPTTDTPENAPETPETPSPEVPPAPAYIDAQNGAEEPEEMPEGETSDDESTEAEDLRAARREAASRRKELRTVEAERDALQGTVAALQRQVAEQLVTTDQSLPYLHKPADLFDIGGISVSDLADDAGGIDTDKLGAALTALKAGRPYLFTDRPTVGFPLYESMMRQGMPSPAPTSGNPAEAWSKALRGA